MAIFCFKSKTINFNKQAIELYYENNLKYKAGYRFTGIKLRVQMKNWLSSKKLFTNGCQILYNTKTSEVRQYLTCLIKIKYLYVVGFERSYILKIA